MIVIWFSLSSLILSSIILARLSIFSANKLMLEKLMHETWIGHWLGQLVIADCSCLVAWRGKAPWWRMRRMMDNFTRIAIAASGWILFTFGCGSCRKNMCGSGKRYCNTDLLSAGGGIILEIFLVSCGHDHWSTLIDLNSKGVTFDGRVISSNS